MDQLHAPWRIEYILSPKPPATPGESVFSRIGQSNDDEANLVVTRSRTCYALLNSYPYNGGHLMIVPYREVSDLHALTDDEMLDLMRVTRRCIDALRSAMHPDGFNVGFNLGRVAGAGIAEHLHLHVVPRWNGDTNFMPVLGATRVLPEALQDVAARLRTTLAATL